MLSLNLLPTAGLSPLAGLPCHSPEEEDVLSPAMTSDTRVDWYQLGVSPSLGKRRGTNRRRGWGRSGVRRGKVLGLGCKVIRQINGEN